MKKILPLLLAAILVACGSSNEKKTMGLNLIAQKKEETRQYKKKRLLPLI